MSWIKGGSFPLCIFLLALVVGNVSATQMQEVHEQLLVAAVLLLSDDFDRGEGSSVGNGWEEIETSGAAAGIQANRLCFLDTSDVSLRPIVRHDFQRVASGQLRWRFDFDWRRQFRENSYQVLMQLGEMALMSDGSPDSGVGVNLVWTKVGGVHEMLAYRNQGADTPLRVISGAASLEMLVDLENQSYDLIIDGLPVQSGIPFDNQVNLDTVRFLTDGLNEVYFAGRCIDNLIIESIASEATLTPTPPATSTATNTVTLTATQTETPLPSMTSTPLPTDTPILTPTSTASLPPTMTSTSTPTETETPFETATPTATATQTPTGTDTAVITNTPTSTWTDLPPDTPTSTPLPSYEIYRMVEILLTGPDSTGMGIPNPFLIEVNVTFQGPQGESFTVPGFYDGDGNGNMDGNLWKVRFRPSRSGLWTYVSASTEPLLSGQMGAFQVITPENCPTVTTNGLPNFSCMGRLEYSGGHYLTFSNGSYWLKGGVDDPEDFLAPGMTVGFTDKQAAVDFLADQGVNSLYLMLQNIGGDGNNVWPWVGSTASQAQSNHERFNLLKMAEWKGIFDYLQEQGIVLHFVLEDDSGWTGFNRVLYYREMVARFGHYNGLIWNISEEFNENYTTSQVKSFAQLIRDLDPYDHPITVHQFGNLDTWLPFVGDNRFDLTGFQTDKTPQNSAAVSWYALVESSGRTIPVSFDETGMIGASDRDLARHILWSVYLGGGIFEMHTFPISDYHDFAFHFEDMRRARTFLEVLPFWEMRPMNELLLSGQAYVFAKLGEIYSAYLPIGGQVSVDLSGTNSYFDGQWFNPRDGSWQAIGYVQGGGSRSFNAPDSQDWVLLLSLSSMTPTATATASATPTSTDTPLPSETPTPSATPSATDTPTVTATPTPTAVSTILFSDAFERADGSEVGNAWVEVEAVGANAGIQGNQLCFLDTSDVLNRPLVRHGFSPVSGGMLTWEYDFNWARTGNEGTYRLFMQIGQGDLLRDTLQDSGAAVNLIWTNLGGVHQTLAYRLNGVTTRLGVVSGAARVRVEANLETGSYAVYVNNELMQAGIPFEDQVVLDTVRLFTDALNEVNFASRCFDNLVISHGSINGSAPLIRSAPTTSGTLWEAYSYDVNASGSPSPVYTLLNPPAGMVIDQATGLITWTPGFTGIFAVTVQVANLAGSDTQQYTLTISTLPQFSCSTPVRIMPLGDSITAGKSSGVDDVTQQVSYRKDLWESLLAAARQVDFVGSLINGQFYPGFDPQHEGHSGWTDTQIAFHIYDNGGENWLSLNLPDVILLHIGTNALNPDPTDVQNILNEIDQYEAATNRRVIVVLARIIDMVPNNPTIHQFNDNVQAMAQARIENGDKVILVDMEDGADLIYSLQPAGDMWDRLHPFASGYTKMASVWLAALEDILPVCP